MAEALGYHARKMPAQPLKIAIVANKSWECEPLVGVLLARDGRPSQLTRFRRGYDPAELPPEKDPATGKPPELPPEADGLPVRGNLPIRNRLAFGVEPTGADVEVWCIEDWMRKQRRKKSGDGNVVVSASSSSSFEKFTFALPRIRERAFGGNPDIIIAFGTAGIPTPETLNGCVIVGSRVYVHDPWLDAPADEIAEQVERYGPLLRDEIKDLVDKRIDSPGLYDGLFAADISFEARHSAEGRFIASPIAPAVPARILAGHGYAALGTINICNYDDYIWADEETLRLFETQVKQREIGSMETTHGLIRLTWRQVPFLFVSGLTNRVPMFNAEASPRRYAQAFVAAHNAAATVAQLVPELARLHAEGKLIKRPSA